MTRTGAVIGFPVQHSLSPAMHNAAFAALGFDAEFKAVEVRPESLAREVAQLTSEDCFGLSVTVPHKQAVMPLCSELADTASAIGAVNCVVVDGGRLIGHNTDAAGFMEGLEEMRDVGERAVILGAGGAAQAVCHGLRASGRDVVVLARRPEKVSWISAELFTESTVSTHLPTCDLLVDTTPTGLRPEGLSELPAPVDPECMKASAVVCSLIYHRDPELLSAARSAGLRTLDGAAMLAYQGELAFELWFGRRPPEGLLLNTVRAKAARSSDS